MISPQTPSPISVLADDELGPSPHKEPFYEDSPTPVRFRKCSLQDSDDSSSSGSNKQARLKFAQTTISEAPTLTNEAAAGRFFCSTEAAAKTPRPNACKLVQDGAELYVVYADYGLDRVTWPLSGGHSLSLSR